MLLCRAQVRSVVQRYVDEVNHGGTARIPHPLGGYEQIKAFEILPRELSVDLGELTPTLKLRRKPIRQNWESLIEEMYERTDIAFSSAAAAASSSSSR